jgi:hypothetical protein
VLVHRVGCDLLSLFLRFLFALFVRRPLAHRDFV